MQAVGAKCDVRTVRQKTTRTWVPKWQALVGNEVQRHILFPECAKQALDKNFSAHVTHISTPLLLSLLVTLCSSRKPAQAMQRQSAKKVATQLFNAILPDGHVHLYANSSFQPQMGIDVPGDTHLALHNGGAQVGPLLESRVWKRIPAKCRRRIRDVFCMAFFCNMERVF